MEILDAIWARSIAPEPDLEPWEWLERNVRNIPYSPVPGGFDSSHDPGIRHAINAICDPAIPLVVLKVAVQKFKTLALELSLAWAIRNDPGPSMFLQDKDGNAKDEMQMRLRPLFENTDGVRELIPTGFDKDKAKNTSILFRNGMPLWVLGAGNPRNLQRRSLRRVFLDECWQYPKDRNAIAEASARVTAFGYLGKVVAASQGSEEGDEFDKLWKTTTQAHPHVQCPECGHSQRMDFFKGMEFDPVRDDDGNYNFQAIAPTVHYECCKCQAEWPDLDETRRDLNKTKVYIPENLNAPSNRVGITDNAMTSMSWAQLVEEYLRAKVVSWAGDIGPLKVFYQKRLALAWGEQGTEDFSITVQGSGYLVADAEAWEDEGIISMRTGKLIVAKGPLNDRPGFVRFRSLSVDVQRDCFYFTLRSWSHDGRSRLLSAGKIISYVDIDALQIRYNVVANMVFIDAGNQPNAEVYPEAAKRGWTCLRGDQKQTFQHLIRDKPGERAKTVHRYYSPVRKVPLGQGKLAKVYHWSNLNCKDILARMLRMPERWGIPDDIEEHFKGFTDAMNSERRTKKNGKWIWTQIGQRPNHLWDCEAQQVAVGCMCKVLGSEVEESETGDTVNSDE